MHEPVHRQNSYVRHHRDEWYKRGTLERFSRRTVLNLPDGNTRTYRHEIFLQYDGKKMQSWRIADEAKLADVRPNSQNKLGAYKAPFDRNLLEVQVYNYFLLRFAFNASDDWRRLDELVAESTEVSVSAEMLDGNKCSVLRLKNASVGGNGDSVFRVFLDPTVGYLARQIVITHAVEDQESFDFVCHIKNFRDFGEGVFFPMESETYVLQANGEKIKPNRFRVEDIEINGSISDELVLPRFPEGTLVTLHDLPVTPTSVATRGDVELIGPNNSVVRTFDKDSNEIVDYLTELRAEVGEPEIGTTDSTSFALIRIVLLAVAAVLVAIGVGWRWKRKPLATL